jgi:carboxymethylenebutenolidase
MRALARVVAILAFPVLAVAAPQDPKPAAPPTPPAPPATQPQDPKPAPKPMGWTGVLDEKEFAALHDLKEGKPAHPLRGTTVEFDGGRHYLTLPEGKPPFAAVIVVHEWWGLNDHVKHWSDRLAADGYAALAVDLYKGEIATDRTAASKAMTSVDPAAAEKTLRAAFAFLGADERVKATKRGVIGWCFGGGWSLALAIAEPKLDAAVVYYGRLVTDVAKLRAIRAPVLGVFGTLDRGIPPESVDAFEKAMKDAERAVTIRRYEAEHAFANPSNPRYDEKHAADAFAHVRRFLAEHLKGQKPQVPATPPKSGDAPRK